MAIPLLVESLPSHMVATALADALEAHAKWLAKHPGIGYESVALEALLGPDPIPPGAMLNALTLDDIQFITRLIAPHRPEALAIVARRLSED